MYDQVQGGRAGWTIAYWMLMAAFILTAALNLLHVRAGFLTSYLADLTVPSLLYVLSRDLVPGKSAYLLRRMRWIGRTPESAAIFFFVASSATEVSQIIWPKGIFAGRFDPWDIAAYAMGLLACYVSDKSQGARRRQGEKVR
ncbi:MAG: hypothetical protein JJE39_13305 [Vicinamibacteria bacterium]|nr:hypothetical protein [Vicinamibacteria bacterium]